MSKEEFLRNLQEALSGEVPPQTVRENLRYYDDYLTSEMRKGRSMEDIVAEIGDAKLVARSIIDATPGGGTGTYEAADYDYADRGTSGTGSAGYRGGQESGERPFGGNVHFYDLNKWYYKLLAVVVVVLILTVVLTIVGGILSLVIPLLPVIGLVVLVMWFVRGFR